MIVRVCMDCGAILGVIPDDRDGRSHGFCGECFEVRELELDMLIRKEKEDAEKLHPLAR